MFSVDDLISDCQVAIRDTDPRRAVREVLGRAVSDPSSVAAALPPERAEIVKLYADDELTLIKLVWAPGMTLKPHDHRMWAAIGIYAGQEDNSFFRRAGGGIVGSGGKVVRDRDVLMLGDDAIHSVHNPLRSFTGAIHVYGGDFFTRPRSEWDPETMEERPMDVAATLRQFEEENEKLAAETGG
jgi:predicted metal-dependent enzyme (double-stranded beta helix superfamily)